MFPPGESDVASYQREEIRAILDCCELRVGITLAASATDIPIGTVLGVVTATGLYVPYDDTKADGSEVAKCILADTVLASTVPVPADAYITGIFYKDRLQGLDTAAITDLLIREPISNIVIM